MCICVCVYDIGMCACLCVVACAHVCTCGNQRLVLVFLFCSPPYFFFFKQILFLNLELTNRWDSLVGRLLRSSVSASCFRTGGVCITLEFLGGGKDPNSVPHAWAFYPVNHLPSITAVLICTFLMISDKQFFHLPLGYLYVLFRKKNVCSDHFKIIFLLIFS